MEPGGSPLHSSENVSHAQSTVIEINTSVGSHKHMELNRIYFLTLLDRIISPKLYLKYRQVDKTKRMMFL